MIICFFIGGTDIEVAPDASSGLASRGGGNIMIDLAALSMDGVHCQARKSYLLECLLECRFHPRRNSIE